MFARRTRYELQFPHFPQQELPLCMLSNVLVSRVPRSACCFVVPLSLLRQTRPLSHGLDSRFACTRSLLLTPIAKTTWRRVVDLQTKKKNIKWRTLPTRLSLERQNRSKPFPNATEAREQRRRSEKKNVFVVWRFFREGTVSLFECATKVCVNSDKRMLLLSTQRKRCCEWHLLVTLQH